MNIAALHGLGALPKETVQLINDNKETIEKALNGTFLGSAVDEAKARKMSFDEVFRLYNDGITTEEVKAWVYYKRSIGVPMRGWEKFYLPGDKNTPQKIAKTTKPTTLKDNHFRDVSHVDANTVLGAVVKEHHYSTSEKYYIVRNDTGLFYVKAAHVTITNNGLKASQQELDKLVRNGALFFADGELLPLAIFTFGNMYDRELQLRDDKAKIVELYGEDVYKNHVQAINDYKPPMLTITSPDAKQRPIISAVSEFARKTEGDNSFYIQSVREEYMHDTESSDQFKKVNGVKQRKTNRERINIDFSGDEKYSLTEVFCAWLYSLNEDDNFEKSSATDIVDYYVNAKSIRDDSKKKEEKAEMKANARDEGEKMFAKFLHDVLTPEDQSRLDFAWNRVYNSFSKINYNKVPVGFECSTRFKAGILKLSEAQREGVAFQEAMGSGINAFDVGVGKTMTAIANVAQNLYSGKSKRPLIVVPKPTYEKWIIEIFGTTDDKTKQHVPGVLSFTDVKLNDWFNLGTDRKGVKFDKAVPENSITIVTYEGFKKLGFGKNVGEELANELINILEQESDGSARNKEINYQKYREMIGVGLRGTVADIETLGFDYLVIDEAHRAKNVFAGVKQDDEGNKRYNMQGAVSDTGLKAFFISNYIQRKYGKSTMLLTATPFTNSPLEIYSMLSHVAHESLVKMNLKNIKDFFDLFVSPTVEWTANMKEQLVEKEIIKSFDNKVILNRLIKNHILYKTGDDANVIRPCKIDLPMLYVKSGDNPQKLPLDKQVLTYLEMTPLQRSNQDRITSLARNAGAKNMGDLFKAMAQSLNNALSPFLFAGTPESYVEFVDESPKIKYAVECIRSVKAWHKERGEEPSGQIIYMNRGKDFFRYIKEYLEKEVGYKKGIKHGRVSVDEVEIIDSSVSDTKKENIKEAFLDNRVKIIIGTATIREGIDLQRNGTVIYNLMPEWNPTDLKQLSGRIHRQGNKYGYVRIVMPLVQDSMDVFVYQKLEEKTARINDIWATTDNMNVMEIENVEPQEIKLALISDIEMLAKMFFKQEAEDIGREFRRNLSALEQMREINYDIKQYKEYKERSIEVLEVGYNRLIAMDLFDDDADKKYDKEKIKKAKRFRERLEAFRAADYKDDKEILALFRTAQTDNYGIAAWFANNFKMYVSKVKKAERNILQPKGFTLDSNIEDVTKKLFSEKAEIIRKATIFMSKEKAADILEMEETILAQHVAFKEQLFNSSYPASVKAFVSAKS